MRQSRMVKAAIGYIGLVTMIALLGYLISPDDTPRANYQFPSLGLRPLGFRTTVVAIPLPQKVPQRTVLHKMISGQPASYKLIPYDSLILQLDTVWLRMHDGGYQTMSASAWEAVKSGKDGGSYITERFFLLGTDRYGRCVWSRLIIGARVSLGVGLIAVAISLVIGIPIGMIGGYFGGRIDEGVMLLINVVWSIPTLLLVFAIVLALGRHPANVFVAVGLTMWVDIARLVRGETIRLKNRTFVDAAQSMGFSHARIFAKHLLPNLVGPLLVVAAANFAMAILIEAGLSYLGFGVPPPQPSWGNMLNENYGFAISGHWHVAFAPIFAIMSLVLAFNLLGSGLRDLADQR